MIFYKQKINKKNELLIDINFNNNTKYNIIGCVMGCKNEKKVSFSDY